MDSQYPSKSKKNCFTEKINDDQIIIGIKFDLKQLSNEKDATLCLNKFEELCKEHNISLIKDEKKE